MANIDKIKNKLIEKFGEPSSVDGDDRALCLTWRNVKSTPMLKILIEPTGKFLILTSEIEDYIKLSVREGMR